MTDKGKEILEKERREERAKDVVIQFVDTNLQHFNVLAEKDEIDKKSGLIKFKKGDIKYYGVVIGKEPNKSDFCTCPSYWYEMDDDYKKTHAEAFQCKHIIEARAVRFEGHP